MALWMHLAGFSLNLSKKDPLAHGCIFSSTDWCFHAFFSIPKRCTENAQLPAYLFPKQLLSWMGFSILARNGLCSLMICWLLLVPAGVPVLVSLLLSSFFPQESGSVPSWFAGSSWFRLGFRCLSPLFSLLSFLRKKFCSIMICWFLLVLAFRCLSPFLFFFFSSGKRCCSIMVCWFLLVPAQERGSVPPWFCGLLVPAGVPVLVSFLLPSFFPQERGSVPSWFAGSSWFRLGFRCLSPFFSLLWFRCLSPFFSLLTFFPQARGSVPSWFAGSSLFRLGFQCLSPFFSLLWLRCFSPFFSLLSFFGKGFLFHHDLLILPGSGWGSGACLPFFSSFFPPERGSVPSWFAGSGWGSGACLPSSLFFGSGTCLPSSLFFLSSGKGFCSIMICWFFLVPAGVPVLVSLIFSSLVPVLVSFFSLLSFLRKGVLFHHDLLFPPGSGWGSGDLLVPLGSGLGSRACLPSSLFFLSSGKGFCSIMVCWFFLVPAGVSVFVSLNLSSLVPVLVSLLLSSFFPQDRGFVPSWFAGSSWFRLRKGVLFHHDLPVPLGSGWGSGACLPSSPFFLSSGKGLCSIMICWFLLVPAGVLVLVSLLLSSLVPVLVSLLLSSFFPQERGIPSWFAGSSWFRLGFRCLSPFFTLLWFRCLSPFFSLLGSIPSWFALPGSGWGSSAYLPYSLFFGSGACLPSSLFFPQERSSVPSWFAGSSWFQLGFRCLSPFFSLLSFLKKVLLFHHDLLTYWFLLVPAGFRCLSPFSSLLSFLRKGVLFHHGFAGSSSFWRGVRCLSSLFFLFSGKGFCSIMDFLVPPASGWGSGACLPSSICFRGSCVSLVGSHMGLCWRYCSQEKTACTTFGFVWKLTTSTLSGFLDASGRLFYRLVFVRLK